MTNHFHANMIEDNGTDREATSLGGSHETRLQAQSALLREAGSIAGQPSFTLTKTSVTDDGLDVIEFLNRNGSTLTLSVWGCTCSQG